MGNLNLSPQHFFWPKRKQWKVLLIGCSSNGPGKSTIFYMLEDNDKPACTIPTPAFYSRTLRYKDCNFLLWDSVSGSKVTEQWNQYLPGTDVLILVVDAGDKEYIENSKNLLQDCLHQFDLSAPENKCLSLLVLANKQDMPGALNCEDLEDSLGLKLCPIPFLIHPCSALRRKGIDDIMKYLCHQVNQWV